MNPTFKKYDYDIIAGVVYEIASKTLTWKEAVIAETVIVVIKGNRRIYSTECEILATVSHKIGVLVICIQWMKIWKVKIWI